MNLTKNEKMVLMSAVKERRREFMTIAKNEIDYLKSMGLDISNDYNISYWVSEINLCTRLMKKIWSY